MSVVPGSPKVTRCTSKPAPLRIFSSTPSAPASAGVTDGQRTRSRAMERASVMPPLNMRHWRWASTVRNKFQFALLVPARGGGCVGTDRCQRVGAEPVGPFRSSQAEQFDKAPDAQTETEGTDQERQDWVVQPVRELVEQAWSNEKRGKPPTALAAIVKPLERGRGKQPDDDDEQGKSEQIERRVHRLGGHKMEIIARSTEDAGNDEEEYRHERKDGGIPDERREPEFSAVDAAFEIEQKPIPVHVQTPDVGK